MFDNVNGAHLAAKRLRKATGATMSEARRVVAIAAGCRDWHHLERVAGTPSFPARPTREEAIERIGRAAPGIDAGTAADAIAPVGGLDWPSLPDMVDMELQSKRGLGQRSAHLTHATTQRGDVRTMAVRTYESYSAELARIIEVMDETDEEVIPDGVCFDQTLADVHDLRWELRRDGALVGVAAGTLYDFDSASYAGAYLPMLLAELDEAEIGDGALLEAVVGTEEGDTQVEGSLLVLTQLHVRASERGRGNALLLAEGIAADVVARVGDPAGATIVIDLDSVRRDVDGMPPIDDHEAVVRRVLRGSVGDALRIGEDGLLIHRADRPAHAAAAVEAAPGPCARSSRTERAA